MNAIERKPVETRVLNSTASEASYKPKQRSYRKTNLNKKVLAANSSSAETYPTHDYILYTLVYMSSLICLTYIYPYYDKYFF